MVSTVLPALSAARTPVIVGWGEAVDRPDDILFALEPLALMAQALARADEDAGGGLLGRADSLDVVNLASWRYADIAASLCHRLNLQPSRAVYGEVGGESPVRLLHDAALRIARGESQIALICGAEAQHSATRARRTDIALPWTPFAKDGPRAPSGRDIVHSLAAAVGVFQPISVYPLYDAASAALWGQTPAQALAESGEIWARYSQVAANNPSSWLKRPYSAEEIVTPSPANRLIAHPYTKLMVANPTVNQGAALIVTSLAIAREAGIAEDRMIHIWGGAAAQEPRDFMARDQYGGSPAQDAVLGRALAIAGGAFEAIELYSCFPCVPKMARRSLGLGPDVAPTVTGGLTFFGAPLSSYMLHAACAMVRQLRERTGKGLLYGQGEFVTKHHALVLSREAPPPLPDGGYAVQAEADSQRGPVPRVVAPVAGRARVETSTVLYDRDGAVLRGVVVLRTGGGERTIAAVPVDDDQTLAALTATDRYPIGREGDIYAAGEGEMRWRLT